MTKVEEAPAVPLPKNFPMPPTFASEAEERQYRRQRLAAACRLFAHFGFDEGFAGHITARDPGRPDCFWVNPAGLHFAHVTASDLLLVDAGGTVEEGGGGGGTARSLSLPLPPPPASTRPAQTWWRPPTPIRCTARRGPPPAGS